MGKAIVTIKVEIDLTPLESDKGLDVDEIAYYAAGALCEVIKTQERRNPKIKSCEFEFTHKGRVNV